MFLFILNLVIAMTLLMRLMSAKMSNGRGTNTLTRFVRDTSSYRKYTTIAMVSIAITALFLLLGLLLKSFLAWTPTAACAGLAFYFKLMSNKSEQRIKDSRNVTKGTMQVVGESGEVLGSAAGMALSAATGGAVPPTVAVNAGKTIGNSAGKGLLKVSDTMDDCNVDLHGCGVTDVEAFKLAASRAGIVTEGKDVNTIAENVVKFAPPAAVKALPDSMTIEDKAMHILGGDY